MVELEQWEEKRNSALLITQRKLGRERKIENKKEGLSRDRKGKGEGT